MWVDKFYCVRFSVFRRTRRDAYVAVLYHVIVSRHLLPGSLS